MYWAVRDDGNYEIIDGQQRTISICQFVKNIFSYDGKLFRILEKNKKTFSTILYQFIFRNGNSEQKLEWFEVINIYGKQINAQERRNAVFHGPWVTDAKSFLASQVVLLID